MRISLLCLLFCVVCIGETLTGRVIKVSDGDTITVLDANNVQHRIRLNCIDAPESKQAYGKKSREFLDKLVYGKNIEVEYKKKDMYGRILGIIRVDKQNVNLSMVRNGWAWHYVYYAKNATEYDDAQKAAQQAKLGLWQDPHPIPPWEFRKQEKEKRKQARQEAEKE